MRARWLLLLVLPVLCGLPFTRAPGVLVSITAMLAVAAALRPALFPLSLIAALGSLAATVVYRGPPQPPGLWLVLEFTPMLILQARGVRTWPTRRALLAGALIALATTVLPLRVTLNQPSHRLDGSILVTAFAFACVVAATGLGLFLRTGDARRARALASLRRVQRLELARDLHDLVAHEVTGIVVEAQAAQVAPDPASHARIEAAGQRALAAMDDMVSALRADEDAASAPRAHGPADLPGVVARFGPAATLSIEPGAELPPGAGTVVYHVVIEALTNVRRHAPAGARVTVTLSAAGILTVSNDAAGRGNVPDRDGRARSGSPDRDGRARSGSPDRDGRPRGGSGLAGLAERVGAVGGTLSAGPKGDGGWEVVCDLSRSADVRRGGGRQP